MVDGNLERLSDRVSKLSFNSCLESNFDDCLPEDFDNFSFQDKEPSKKPLGILFVQNSLHN